MKKKILLGSIIAIVSLQALGGLTGIDNLSSLPSKVRMILQNGKTTEWRNLNANPAANKNQRGSKTVFNNIDSKNVRIEWMQELKKGLIAVKFTFKTQNIGDARDIYIHNDGRCEIYQWGKIYFSAFWAKGITFECDKPKSLNSCDRLTPKLKTPIINSLCNQLKANINNPNLKGPELYVKIKALLK